MLYPTKYIIFDSPLGCLHYQTGKYIDIWMHIDVPLDISLCRYLLREFKNTHKTKEEILEEIEYYLSQSRPLFFDDAFKASANLIIDGMLATEEQLQKINAYLKREN